MDDRRVTKDAAVAGSECTRKAVEVSSRSGAEGKFPPADEDVRRNQASKGTEETTSVGDDHDSGMEGEFVVCEHTMAEKMITNFFFFSTSKSGPK